jgi:hypothetical protein
MVQGVEPISDSNVKAAEPGIDTQIVRAMHEISLHETGAVRLMNRTDTKYVLRLKKINQILSEVAPYYDVQEIDGIRIASYKTVYYDTPSLSFFHDHMNGKLNRHKIRIRSYLDCDLHFLEVKRKMNTGKTRKNRIRIKGDQDSFDEVACDLVNKYTSSDLFLLFPVLTDYFKRITLVNKSKTERVTLDFNLTFEKVGDGKRVSVPDLAIIEIKQDKVCISHMGKALLEARVKKSGISKYCLGISLTESTEKHNKIKLIIRNLLKLTNYELIV